VLKLSPAEGSCHASLGIPFLKAGIYSGSIRIIDGISKTRRSHVRDIEAVFLEILVRLALVAMSNSGVPWTKPVFKKQKAQG